MANHKKTGPLIDRMTQNVRIKCPICGATATKPWKDDDGRWYFPHHGPNILDADSCIASGWLIEAEDIIAPGYNTQQKEKVSA